MRSKREKVLADPVTGACKIKFTRAVSTLLLLWGASSVGAEPVLNYSFPGYRMAISPSVDHPNKMEIRAHEHISGYSKLEATGDFPGTVEVDYWYLKLTASTGPGSGNVYLTARDDDGGELNVTIAVEVIAPFSPLPPAEVRCAGETADGFLVAWKKPYYTSGFPDVAAVQHRISGGGVEREGHQLVGNSSSASRWANFEVVSGLQANTRYQVRLRSAHFDYFGGANQPVYYSEFVTVTCTTRSAGYRIPSPDLTHVHVYQGLLVDTFPQGGRTLRVPTTENRYGEPWRVPLILGKETTVAAEALFDEWDPDVQINGESVSPHRRRVEVDDASGRLLARFARTFAEAPGSIEIATDGVTRRQIRHNEFKVGTAEVPPWTALLVPVDTPVRTVTVSEYTAKNVREDLLNAWPFGRLETQIGSRHTSSVSCEDDSPRILRELADSVSAPARTVVVGIVGQPSNGGPVCIGEDGWFIKALAFQGRPYVLVRCTEHERGCLPHSFVAHAFGHTTGLPHLEELDWCDDCGADPFPYYGTLVAPFLSGRDAAIDMDWVRAPLFWRHGLVYGAWDPNGEPRASGRWRSYTVYQDTMSAGWGTGNRTADPLQSDRPSDHTYRLMLDHLRGDRVPVATDRILD